jgi:hypothetical protein
MLKIAFARIAILAERDRLRRLREQALAEVQLEAELKGEDTQSDLDADSLQMRLLNYMETTLGFQDLSQRLKRNHEARLLALQKVRRQALLGLHSANKELGRLVEGFSDYELFLLNQVVTSDNPAERLRSPDLVDLFTRRLRAGSGKNLVEYLADRMFHLRRRSEQPEAGDGHEADGDEPRQPAIFNAELLVVGMLWTDPHVPFWLMPSVGATNVINRILEAPDRRAMSKESYNKLVSTHGLCRLRQPEMDKLLRDCLSDLQGRELRRQLEEVMGVALSSARRGPKPRR